MSAAVATEAIDTDLIVRGYRTSKVVELDAPGIWLYMTPEKAYELAQAILTVIGEIR